jgi:bacterioferritin (cytochrome b1)
MSEKELFNLIESQIKIEKSTTKKIKEFEEGIANLAAKLLLAEMRLDTEKHAKILETMLNYLKTYASDLASKKFWQIETSEYMDALTTENLLKKHITVETKMLEHVKKAIKKTDDEAVKLLFKHIIDDEKKHHEIMKTILKKAFKIVSMP